METIDFYAMFATQFRVASLQSLVEQFNKSVGVSGYSLLRSTYNVALVDEFVRRGIDVSVVRNGKTTSFAHRVALNDKQDKLIIADEEGLS
jgi:hypothetical protein